MYNVASKALVAQCFGVFCRRFIRRLSKVHHINVCLCNFVVRCIRRKEVAHIFTVRHSCALHFALMQLQIECETMVDISCNRLTHKIMEVPQCGVLAYIILFQGNMKAEKHPENGNLVKPVKWLRHDLYLYGLGLLGNIWSDFIIIMS